MPVWPVTRKKSQISLPKKLEELGHTVDVDECTTVDAADFEDADICIVATYTYGDGELPDEIVDFYEDLADLDLSGKIFGVVGFREYTFYVLFSVHSSGWVWKIKFTFHRGD